MAGYIIYSLDWDKFSALINNPTPQQLDILAQLIADQLEDLDGEFEDHDPILAWPNDAKALAPLIAQRLTSPDWYSDLSEEGKNLWESVIFSACMNAEELGLDLGFRVDSDGIYWDVIELGWKQFAVRPNTINEIALSTFGTQPFGFVPDPDRKPCDDWFPMHSMHTPEVTQRLLQELRSLAPVIEEADEDVQEQYDEELMPALERIVQDRRLLFVQVDT